MKTSARAKKTLLIFLFFMALGPIFLYAEEGGYFKNLQHDYKRGMVNILTSPAEIPITIQEYHEGAGRPLIRHLAGAVDGAFRMFTRAASGAWDLVFGWIPGDQEGFPPDPETLF